MLMMTIFAFLVIGGFLVLGIILLSLIAAATGFLPLALFIILFGVVIGLLLLMGVNAFVDGVHYHLSMQAVSRRRIDMDLAWKLASARWKDAWIVQGSVNAMILIALLLSLVVSVIVSPPVSGWSWLLNPAQWVDVLAIPLIIGVALLVALQPFLFLLLPSVYFDNATPSQVFKRLFQYVKPRYWMLLVAALGVLGFNLIVSGLAEWATQWLSVESAPIVALVLGLFGVLIQLFAILFTFSATVNIQTVAFLHAAKPKEVIQFTSSDFVSRALSRMARDKPSHSGRLPVKWKSPSRKR
jgi:MFS family permease